MNRKPKMNKNIICVVSLTYLQQIYQLLHCNLYYLKYHFQCKAKLRSLSDRQTQCFFGNVLLILTWKRTFHPTHSKLAQLKIFLKLIRYSEKLTSDQTPNCTFQSWTLISLLLSKIIKIDPIRLQNLLNRYHSCKFLSTVSHIFSSNYCPNLNQKKFKILESIFIYSASTNHLQRYFITDNIKIFEHKIFSCRKHILFIHILVNKSLSFLHMNHFFFICDVLSQFYRFFFNYFELFPKFFNKFTKRPQKFYPIKQIAINRLK